MTARVLLVLAVVLFMAGPAGAQDRRGQSDQQILIDLEKQWDAAFLKNDVAFVDGVLAQEFVAIYDDGSRGDRTRELKLVEEFNQQIDSSTLDDFLIKIYGDTAVVGFTRTLVGPSKGQRLEYVMRYLDVFVMRDGRWQCVVSQSTRVGKPAVGK
ncbi:MAG: nuclear transport factor 2 family protein [Vicinamibacterales bacterium]